ncbi:hypothetical protein N752_00990 [Desulforamulus aquiferis]|nr:copper amine oxidase N-terminal domain-containing protein [Desulforamulus aquiferis]RYD07190.1 hypothetical protein N752_00990 [Desulforamulus aquiferis]
MRKIMMMIMVALMMVSMVVSPAFGEVVIKPGNGGEVDHSNTPSVPFPGTGGTVSKPTQPVDNSIKIIVNGTKLNPDVAPFIDTAGRTQAPFRAIGEALGCKVTWNADTQKVICERDGFKVEMVIGQKSFIVNGESKTMDTAPVIKDGRTFIPVRFLGEALNCNVAWDATTNTVTISSK